MGITTNELERVTDSEKREKGKSHLRTSNQDSLKRKKGVCTNSTNTIMLLFYVIGTMERIDKIPHIIISGPM